MAGCFCTGACRLTGVCPVGGVPRYVRPYFVTTSDYDTTQGVWVVWEYDVGPEVRATFGSEIDALRYAVNECHGAKVVFLPHGVTLRDHLASDIQGDNA